MWSASRLRACFVVSAVIVLIAADNRPAYAQGHDSLVNGAIIGAVVGASAGVGFTHAVRDSDLTVGQYASAALVFGAIGAGAGLGVDALFSRARKTRSPQPLRPLFIAPAVWRDVAGVVVKWKW